MKDCTASVVENFRCCYIQLSYLLISIVNDQAPASSVEILFFQPSVTELDEVDSRLHSVWKGDKGIVNGFFQSPEKSFNSVGCIVPGTCFENLHVL